MAWTSHLDATRPPARLLLVAAAAAAALLPYAGVERSARPAPPPGGALAMAAVAGTTALADAVGLSSRFGLAGTAQAPVRAADPISGAVADTVEFRTADGRLAAVVRRGLDGHLLQVIDLTDPPQGGPVLADAAVPAAARRLLTTAGVPAPSSEPATTWDAGMDAWCVRWVRTIGTVPAPTDGLVTWVRSDGRLKALTDLASPLAPAPADPIPPATASAAARAYAARLRLDRQPSLSYEAPRLEWILPDGFIDPVAADAGTALRLAWVVRLSYVPPGWRERRIVELDVDAGSGALIGGTETA